jgi:hypothetical protein
MAGINFAAQVVDVDVDYVGHSVEPELPDLLDNRTASHWLPFVSHQELEERKFPGAKLDCLAGAVNVMRYAVYLEIINSEHAEFKRISSPQDRANAGGKLGKCEGLGQAIVNASVEKADAVLNPIGRRDCQDGQIRALCMYMGEEFEANTRGEIKIQDEDIEGLVRGKTLCFPGVGDQVNRKLFPLQVLAEMLRQRCVFFCDQNAHRLTLNNSFGRG